MTGQPGSWRPVTEPLRLTTARWRNDVRRYRSFPDGAWCEKPVKKIAHKGPLTQFAYGQDHPSTWPHRDLQRSAIGAPHTRVFFLDVDYPDQYATTRTAALVGRQHAWSTRGERFHVPVDARAVPEDQWPRQRPIAGADVKANGWVPVPGSTHYSGEKYEFTGLPPDAIIRCTPELLAAIAADQADAEAGRKGSGHGGAGGHGGGSGHDDEVSGRTMGMILKRLRAGWQPGPELKQDVHAEWLTVAIPRDPSDPFTDEDFDRHYGDERQGGLEEALKVIAADQQVVTPGAVMWAQSTQQQGGTVDPGPHVEQARAAREALREHIRGWLGERECGRADFAAAVCCTRNGGGEPPWGMMIDAASGGKTEVVRMAGGVRDAPLDEFTSASLLSFSKAKEPKKVGVLTRIPAKALITIADFSTILASSDRGLRDQLFADLRRVYDGELNRDLGNMERGLSWTGRVTMLAASTPAVDEYSSHSDKLGPRWLYHRGVPTEVSARKAGARRRITEKQLEDNRARARELFTRMVTHGAEAYPDIELTAWAEAEIGDVAVAATICRSAVPRDGYGKREIIGLPVVEEPYRLAAQLRALARGAMALGYGEADAVALARRCAFDTVTPVRVRVLMALAGGAVITSAEAGRRSGADRKVARRALEDLRALGITECPAEDASNAEDTAAEYQTKFWRIQDEESSKLIQEEVEKLTCENSVPKSGDKPPNPPRSEIRSVSPHFWEHPPWAWMWAHADLSAQAE